MRRLRWMGLVVLMAAGRAQAEAPPVDEDLAKARDLVTDGSAQYAQGHFDKALERFNAAYTLSPRPKIIFNIAQSELALGQDAAAATDFQRFLDRTVNDESVLSFQVTAAAKLEELTRRLARLRLETVPPEAQRMVDGKPAPNALVYAAPAPATHTVTVVAPGFVARSLTVTVNAGELSKLQIELQKEPEVAARPDLAPKSTPSVAPALTAAPPPQRSRTAAYVLLGTAGVLAAGAGTMALLTHGEYHALPPNPTGVTTSAEKRELTHARITDALWAGAIVTAGVGGYLYFHASPQPGGAAASVGGTF